MECLAEVPNVRKDCGYPPLVTPSSQIVGTQAVMNVVMGERYKMVPKESKALLRGEYGKLPAEVNEEVRKKAIGDEEVITCRPADLLEPELEKYKAATVNLNARKRRFYETTLASYEEGYVEESSASFTQTIIQIGDVAIVSFPYEIFSEIGMRIAKSSPIPFTLSLANANGAGGYMVTQDQLCRGGYEVDMFMTRPLQRFVDNTDHQLITQTLTHLRTFKGE